MPVFNICEINTEVKVSKPPFNKLVLVYSLKVRITTSNQNSLFGEILTNDVEAA